MKMFIPAVGHRIVLDALWSFDLYFEHRNETLLNQVMPDWKDHRSGVVKGMEASLPRGTVLEIDRVYIRTANKRSEGDDDYDSVTFKVIDKEVKKKLRFWAKLDDVNEIRFTIPEDFDVSKKEAAKKAKDPKPKKFTPSMIKERIEFDAGNCWYNKNKKPAAWYKAAVPELKKLLKVYHERERVISDRRSKEHVAKAIADSKSMFAVGNISIPIALADKIKTFDDYYEHMLKDNPYYNIDHPKNSYTERDDVPYFLKSVLMDYSATSKFRREGDTCVRRYEGTKPRYDHNADVSDMWVEIITNKEDNEIIGLTCGRHEYVVPS